MKTRDSILVALPALLLGLGAGYLFSSLLVDRGAEPSGRGASVAANNAAIEDAPAARKDVLAAAPAQSERGVAEAKAEKATPKVSDRELARAMEGVHAPSIAAGRGSAVIFGTVLDEDGAPLAGVTVIGTGMGRSQGSDPADVGKAAPDDASLEDALRAAADSWARSRAGLRRAVTGADGSYELANVDEDKSYRLSAYSEGYVLEAEGSPYSVAPGSRVDFTAAEVYVIPVELVHADGTRPEEGLIQVKHGNSTESYAWTPDAPELRLRSGRVAVRGFANVHAGLQYGRELGSDFASEEKSLDAAENAGVPLVLELAPRNGIRGRVVDGSASGSDRPMVRMMPVPDGASVDLVALAQAEQTWPQNDRFAFLDLAPGAYAVGLGSWNEPILVHEVVTVGAGIVDVELVVPEPDPEQTLFLHALGPDGAPLRDLDFGWRYEQRNSSSSGGIQGRRQPDGAWALRPKPEFFAPWTPETRFTLTVTHAQLGSREVVLAEGQREVTVTFEEPVSIVLVIRNYVGSGYEGRLSADVSKADDRRGSRNFSYSGSSDDGRIGADGVARFEKIAPGDWRVTLSVRVGQWETRPIGMQEVSVRTAEKTVRMDIPALFELAVFAPELTVGAHVQLRPAGGDPSVFAFGSSEQLDADKRAVFRGLVAGTYRLSGAGMHDGIEVTVPCGEVILEAREPNCFRVVIGDLEGVLYASGLRAGDLIVGADGKRYQTTAEANDLFRGSGTAQLIVLRGGSELTVSLPRGLYTNGADLGGSLTPTRLP